jgi:hypothetical protein
MLCHFFIFANKLLCSTDKNVPYRHSREESPTKNSRFSRGPMAGISCIYKQVTPVLILTVIKCQNNSMQG